jgi:hypothetical protein
MGKRARAKRHLAKMQAKRAVRAARKAFYESLRGTSKNKKSKREVRRGKKARGSVKLLREVLVVPVELRGVLVLTQRTVHGGESCGNVGCKRCSALWQDLVDKLRRK